MTLIPRTDGLPGVEEDTPAGCSRCGAPWDGRGGQVIIGTELGRRWHECLACGYVDGLPGGKHACAPMNAPDHGYNWGTTR